MIEISQYLFLRLANLLSYKKIILIKENKYPYPNYIYRIHNHKIIK